MSETLPKSENPEREGRILDAAARLIMHYGYDKTTVSDIAQEAGISKGAIYLHFDSKEALFEALLWREMERYTTVWIERLEADPMGGTFAGIYKNTLYAMQSSPLMMALFRRDRRVLGAYARKETSGFALKTESNVALLKMMQAAGAVRQDIKPEIVAHIMNMLAYGLVSMDEVVPVTDIPAFEDIIEGIADILDRALSTGENAEAGKQIVLQMIQAARQQFDAIKHLEKSPEA
jgi:TetR/AcrR family acrAB operon transcriptional repressor